MLFSIFSARCSYVRARNGRYGKHQRTVLLFLLVELALQTLLNYLHVKQT